MPIDIRAVANKLNYRPELLFGRLYYHLDEKYRYKDDRNVSTHLFAFEVGGVPHCVNFPYLTAIAAEMNIEHRRNLYSLGMSILALVSSGALLVSKLIGGYDIPSFISF